MAAALIGSLMSVRVPVARSTEQNSAAGLSRRPPQTNRTGYNPASATYTSNWRSRADCPPPSATVVRSAEPGAMNCSANPPLRWTPKRWVPGLSNRLAVSSQTTDCGLQEVGFWISPLSPSPIPPIKKPGPPSKFTVLTVVRTLWLAGTAVGCSASRSSIVARLPLIGVLGGDWTQRRLKPLFNAEPGALRQVGSMAIAEAVVKLQELVTFSEGLRSSSTTSSMS